MSRFSPLLSWVEEDKRADDGSSSNRHTDAFTNAPVFTVAVHKFIHSKFLPKGSVSELIPHYGLIGIRKDTDDASALEEDRLVLSNMNMPWSAFICGSQGAGKSHTLSCLLENALLVNHAAAGLANPLASMVMHYDRYASHSAAQVCETAYLCSSGIPVTVLVSPSNIWAMNDLYSNLPGLKPGTLKPKVLPLYLEEHQLDITRILKLMAVDPTDKNPPLYMEVVMNIAREMAMEGVGFTYSKFRGRLEKVEWLRGQVAALDLRLQLLDAIIKPSSTTKTTRPAPAEENIWAFKPGTLTIIDLSDPFFSSDDACTLFSICLSIFLEERNKCGRVVVLDEAHKFLSQSGEAKILTDDLLSIIRQQRHTGTRVLIATQEPTLSPKLIDLANATFVHRFVSPSWYETLKQHLAGANKQDPGSTNVLFDKIVGLRTGEALLFCPTAQIDTQRAPDGWGMMMKPLGNGYVRLKIRKRITADGGKSIMATDTGVAPTRTVFKDVPMHVVTSKPAEDKKGRKKDSEGESSVVKAANGEGNTSSKTPTTITKPAAISNLSTGSSLAGPSTTRSLPNEDKIKAEIKPKAENKAREENKIRTEIKRQGEAMLKKSPGDYTTGMTRALRSRIISATEDALGLPSGTILKSKDASGFLGSSELNKHLAQVKRKLLEEKKL
ncbi:hypothetical protein AAE478_010262 [Parahypoxylon ruwenzoriense]